MANKEITSADLVKLLHHMASSPRDYSHHTANDNDEFQLIVFPDGSATIRHVDSVDNYGWKSWDFQITDLHEDDGKEIEMDRNDERYLSGFRTIEIFNNINRENRERKEGKRVFLLSNTMIRQMKGFAHNPTFFIFNLNSRRALIRRELLTGDGEKFTPLGRKWCKENGVEVKG